ncbi:hypothetical protein BC829DRAFT_408387 [Chytridium lagenaria]|nr:hypothetical protein BC829DRAFT_408387 [Chytridium lagenaria]
MMANLRAKHALGYPSDMFVYTKAMHLLLNEKRDAEGVITLYAEVRARKLTPSSSVISVVFEAAILLKDPETALKVMHEARTAKWYLAEDVGYCSFFARAMMTKPELFNDLPGFYQKALPGEHPNLMVLTDLIKGLRRLTVSDPNGKYIRKVCQVYQTFTGHPDYKNEAVNLTIRALLERKQFDAAYDLFNTDALLKNDPFANNAFVGYLSGSGKYKEMWEWIEGMKSIFSRIDASTWGVAFAGTWKEGEKFGEEANKVLAKFRECFFDSTLEVGVRRAAGMMKKYGSLAKAFAKKGDGDIKKGMKQAASTSKGASAESA